ncbi:hypothetical protein BCh11DRAFT_06424 [Burkholderia sp. Ch1-1]|nr:hypothetical protein BCh11DRAFT_06424 [Burkholderia sp. Ch1-1]
MKERPILFSGAMVLAMLDGSKTQTRRVVRDQATLDVAYSPIVNGGVVFNYSGTDRLMQCPHGVPGDRLWVREAWRTTGDDGRADDMPPRDLQPHTVWYEADGAAPADECVGKYRPPMFMPRWASRITLEVTGVRVERLQDINEADAQAEGVSRDTEPCDHIRQSCEDIGCLGQTHKASFCNLWCDLNGIPSWTKNPWVWVVEFRRIRA